MSHRIVLQGGFEVIEENIPKMHEKVGEHGGDTAANGTQSGESTTSNSHNALDVPSTASSPHYVDTVIAPIGSERAKWRNGKQIQHNQGTRERLGSLANFHFPNLPDGGAAAPKISAFDGVEGESVMDTNFRRQMGMTYAEWMEQKAATDALERGLPPPKKAVSWTAFDSPMIAQKSPQTFYSSTTRTEPVVEASSSHPPRSGWGPAMSPVAFKSGASENNESFDPDHQHNRVDLWASSGPLSWSGGQQQRERSGSADSVVTTVPTKPTEDVNLLQNPHAYHHHNFMLDDVAHHLESLSNTIANMVERQMVVDRAARKDDMRSSQKQNAAAFENIRQQVHTACHNEHRYITGVDIKVANLGTQVSAMTEELGVMQTQLRQIVHAVAQLQLQQSNSVANLVTPAPPVQQQAFASTYPGAAGPYTGVQRQAQRDNNARAAVEHSDGSPQPRRQRNAMPLQALNVFVPPLPPIESDASKKDLSITMSAALSKVESAIRNVEILVNRDGEHENTSLQAFLQECHDHIGNKGQSQIMLKHINDRYYLITGVIGRSICNMLFEQPILLRFEGNVGQKFSHFWRAEKQAAHGPAAGDLVARHKLAEERAYWARTITNIPGFQQFLQVQSAGLTSYHLDKYRVAFAQAQWQKLSIGLYHAINDCLRISIRILTEPTITEFYFPRVGVPWNAEFMVHRNLEFRRQTLDNDHPPWVVRCTTLPLVKQKWFGRGSSDAWIVHKAEIVVGDRKRHLRPGR